MAENDKMRNCKEGFKRIRMKVMQSERLDKAREEIRQKMRELKKAGKAAAASAAANPRLMRLKAAMKRKQNILVPPTRRNCSMIGCTMTL